MRCRFYVPDWHMHRDAERYMEGLLGYARPIEGPPLPGDIALFRFGRVFSHGAIVVEWPRLIHAYWSIGVVWGDATLYPLKERDVRFFSPFGGAGGCLTATARRKGGRAAEPEQRLQAGDAQLAALQYQPGRQPGLHRLWHLPGFGQSDRGLGLHGIGRRRQGRQGGLTRRHRG